MKKILITITTVVAPMLVAFAGGNLTKEQARIYINPGHGSWGSNDRNLATINHAIGDTTGFYESNTNLWKGLKMGATLEKFGVPKANIMYSRVKNGPYPTVVGGEDEEKYNRNLTEIAEECNAFNTDYFLSIHSDAATDGESTNLSLLIYNGYDTPTADPDNMWEGSNSLVYQETSRAMAETLWPILVSNGIDVFSSTTPRIRGDLSFYYGYTGPSDNTRNAAGYLGVLRRNTCNGFLSEGYCHTYQPARHRALNPDYCGQEGVRYARAVAKWFGWETETTGYIMGSVKDLHEFFSHSLYHPNTSSLDRYKPINGATVVLYKAGVEIARYTTDNEWNGVFVFENLEPAEDYSIDVMAEGYKSLSELNEEYDREMPKYSVTSNETTYMILQLEKEGYVANPTYNYPEPLQEEWLQVADSYQMRQDFISKSLNLDGKTIRREIAKGDSVYVLALDSENKPSIYCYKASTQELLFEVSTTGIGNTDDEYETLAISDIAMTADSVLVACNQVKTSFTPTGTFRTYKWGRNEQTRAPEGDPEEWFTSSTNYTSGNFTNATTGSTMAVSGPSEKCVVITTAQTTGSSGEVRLPLFTITRKGLVGTIRNQDKTHFTVELLGDDYQLQASPLVESDVFVIDGSNTTPFEFTIGGDVEAPTYGSQFSEEVVKPAAGSTSYFRFAKHAFAVVPTVNGEGAKTGVELYDVTDGFDSATKIETTNTAISPISADGAMTFASPSGSDISIYLTANGATSRFTTEGVEQKVYKAVFAHGLKETLADGVHTITFEVNDDCEFGGRVIFYDSTTGDEIGEKIISNVVKGSNSVEISDAELPGEENTNIAWGIEVSNHKVWGISNLLPKSGDYAKGRMYATVDCSAASPNMGKIYVVNYSGSGKTDNGLFKYSANDYTLENADPINGGTFVTPTTMAIDATGNLYVTDSDASKAGLWFAKSGAEEGTFSQYFEGTNTSGIISNGDVEVAGVASSVAFRGTGADTKMYAYMKNKAGNYVVNIYNVGTAEGTVASTWGIAPSKTVALPSEMTADATIIPVEQGLWISNVVSSQSVSEDSPTLIFVDYDGNVKLNLGLEENQSLLEGVSGGAMALSNDEATLVVNDESGDLQFYDVAWTDDTPTLTKRYSYSHGLGVAARRVLDGTGLEQMAFDPAGNLVVGGHYLGVLTIPSDENVCVTKATTLISKASGINETIADDDDAPVEYYNLQGVRVVNPEQGIYIRKQGSRAEKVFIK